MKAILHDADNRYSPGVSWWVFEVEGLTVTLYRCDGAEAAERLRQELVSMHAGDRVGRLDWAQNVWHARRKMHLRGLVVGEVIDLTLTDATGPVSETTERYLARILSCDPVRPEEIEAAGVFGGAGREG